MNLSWTDEEKRLLLEALETYGLDLNLISAEIPTKSLEDIRQAIFNYERYAMGKQKLEDETEVQTPINSWIEILKDIVYVSDASKDITTAVQLLAYYEDHTESKVNLRNCYEFIADLMAGKAPKKLVPEEEKFIIKCVSRLATVTTDNDNKKEVGFLNNLNHNELFKKTYVKKNSSVVMDPLINILKVPNNLLKK